MKCRIIGNSFFCNDESAEMQERVARAIRELDEQTKSYSIEQLFGLIVGDVDERFILELIKNRGSRLKTELADKDRQLAEALADVEHWKSECNALQRMVHESRAEIESKNRLIEQMRDALKAADDLIDEYAADYEHRDNVDEIREEIKAALSAAERGE